MGEGRVDMDGISTWALGVSCCAVMVGIAELIITDTGMEKTVRLVLGGVMLCAVLLPLGDVMNEVRLELPVVSSETKAQLDAGLENAEIDYLKDGIGELVRNVLRENGINAGEVNINMDIGADKCINIITAEIILPRESAGRAGEVSSLLRERLGIGCRTVIG